MIKNSILISTLFLLLPACGTLYNSPVTGPLAKLRVIANNSEGYFVFTRDTTNVCSRSSPNFPMLGGMRNPDLTTISMPNESKLSYDRFERVIPAKNQIKIYASSMRKVGFSEAMFVMNPVGAENIRNKAWACNVLYKFTPEEGRSYEVHYEFSPEKCAVSVEDISSIDGNLVRKIVPFEFKDGASCD
jgi:hypothetical protein